LSVTVIENIRSGISVHGPPPTTIQTFLTNKVPVVGAASAADAADLVVLWLID
jgi:hypothetical protein